MAPFFLQERRPFSGARGVLRVPSNLSRPVCDPGFSDGGIIELRLTRMLDSIGKCSGHSGFRERKINLSQAINFYTPELLTVLEGDERPTATAANAEAVTSWD